MSPGVKTLARVADTGALIAAYTCPAATQAITSSVVVQNRTPTSGLAVRITVALAGEADAATQDVLDVVLGGGQRLVLTEGWALAAGDVLRVNAAAGLTVRVFGRESTPS